MCVWLLSLSLSSDVSTFQEDDYCRDQFDVEDRKKIDYCLVDRVLILHHDCLIDFQNKKINYWLNVEDSRKKIDYWRIDRVLTSHHNWLTDIQNRKINYWLSFSQTHDHSRWLTMRQVKVRYIHRSQREDFFILADSRSFSLTHDAHSKSEVHSSPPKKELRRLSRRRAWSFISQKNLIVCLVMRISHSDDLILSTRVFRRTICFAESLIE